MRRAVALAGLLAFGCGPHAPSTSNVIVVGIRNAPVNLDPGIAPDEASQKIGQLVYSSLMTIGPDLRPRPDLAIRVDHPDPKTYLIEARHGVHFHDGHELTSDDVAYTFRRFLDPSLISGRKGAYRILQSVTPVDRYTTAFHLSQPTSSFLTLLVMSIVASNSAVEVPGVPAGSGPYRISAVSADDYVRLTAFPGYYGGAPANDGILFRVIPDETMRGLELQHGGIDLVVNDLAPDLAASLLASHALNVITAPGTDYAYVGFNVRDPALGDRRVRQAIAYAIDRGAIVKYLMRGFAEVAVEVLPTMSWAYTPDVPHFDYDPAKARALLDAAGYRDPGHGQPRLRLTLRTSTDAFYRMQASVIQQDLAQVGIALEIRSSEFATFMSDVVRGDAELYTLQWVGGATADPDILRRIFDSSQFPPAGLNRGRYSNPDVDRLLDAATQALDDHVRQRYYDEAARLIASDVPYVSLWHRTNAIVFDPALRGVTLSPVADFAFLQNVSRGR